MKIKLFFVLFALISAITVIPLTTGLTVSYADEPTGHTCEECEGSGIRTTSVTCSVCDGIGEIANTSVCDSCGGNPMDNPEGVCPTCGGTGYISGTVPCSGCSGGVIITTYDCEVCNKTGTYYILTYNMLGQDYEISDVKYNGTIKLSSAPDFRSNEYTLTGWNTAADRSGTHYDLGSDFELTQDVTLYAELAEPMHKGFLRSLIDFGSGVAGTFNKVINGVVALIYTPGADGEFGSFTFIGVVMLAAMAIGLFYVVVKWIKGIINMRN